MSELTRKKNEASEIMFAMVDSTTPANLKSGLTVTDDPYYKDGAGAWTASTIADAATEIGTTGMYTIEMTAAELNHDLILIKLSATGAADTIVVIRTTTHDIDDVNTVVPDAAGVAPTAAEIRIEMDTNSAKMAPSQTLDDYKATGFNTVIPDAAGTAATPTDVASALSDINLDHLMKNAVDTDFATTVHLDSVIGQLADIGTTATFDRTTDALEAIRNVEPHGSAMVGTDGANTTTPPTVVEIRTEMDTNSTKMAPSQTLADYKADVSALALEASLNDIKGTGFVKDTHSLPQCITATGFSTHNAADIWAVGTRALTDKAGFALLATGADLILKDSTFALAMADAIWDEILTGTTHNIATSAGKRVRQIGAYAIHDGTAQAGAINSITLATTATGGDGVYNRNLLVVVGGTGVGQTRTIVDYDDTTKVCVVDRDWRVIPDATTAYQIVAADTPLVVDHGVAQGGTATTITLRDYASAVDNVYSNNIITIIAGSGVGETRLVKSYDGTTKVATMFGDDWVTTPDTSSVYVMMPYGCSCIGNIHSDALTQIRTEMEGSGYFLDLIKADTNELQTDWVDGGRLDLILDACALEATVAALNDLSAAQVNAEVADVWGTDTIAEMAQGAPPANPTAEQALNYLYRKLRNKTETTSSEDAVYDDAGTTKLVKSTLTDDGTTFTKSEYISG